MADFKTYSVQAVEFGKNLLDVKITQDHTERVTALIPYGAKLKTTDGDGNEIETDERVGISEVNGGVPYVYDEKAVKEIGWIWTSEVWDEVNLAGVLLKKANTRLSELIKGIVSMELTIVDESDTGADIGDIHARQYVDCKSPPHGIDGRYLCISKTTDYLNPASNTITIGASGVKLTTISVKQNQNISELEEKILGQTSKIEKINGKLDEINASKMYRTELICEGTSIFKNKGQQSILKCRVYSWDKDITDTIDAACFRWYRKSDNEESDADWDSNHVGMKQIYITTEDVLDNASFYCVVNMEEE